MSQRGLSGRDGSASRPYLSAANAATVRRYGPRAIAISAGGLGLGHEGWPGRDAGEGGAGVQSNRADQRDSRTSPRQRQ